MAIIAFQWMQFVMLVAITMLLWEICDTIKRKK
jgi:hypothetical protein